MCSFGPDDIASGTSMDEVYRLAQKASQLNANALILGESGVGKEYLARQIHRFRDPEGRRFKVYRCCSSGHDFEDIRRLLFMAADKGSDNLPSTLFLKSLERVDDKTQLRLLEVLDEEKTLGLLTGTSALRRPRVICSSEKDWLGVQGGDGILPGLAYHLDIIHIEIPPLRERKAEILFLANLFLRQYKAKYRKELTGFSLEARCSLLDYDWPGNVRELRNVVEEAVILASDPVVTDLCLP